MFDTILNQLVIEHPHLNFKEQDEFLWSPKDNSIHYSRYDMSEESTWSLLHELAHALLEHKNFSNDFHLLKLEIAAWQQAKDLAKKYGIQINEDHIETCLDTYRDWIHLRSKCPTCEVHALQVDPEHYECHNCLTKWKVGSSRLCRVKRTQLA